MPGILFVVATPIGNLEDVTLRALRILREADLVAAEDTRRTGKLLSHYQIRKPMVSLHEHNEFREAPRLVHRLLAGESIALVSDAGTPGISDPGARLVRNARAAGIDVVPIPGPSAVTAALSVAGFDETEFTFLGFPPASGAERSTWLTRLASEPRILVLFEAPHRIERLRRELQDAVGSRPILVLRELTKIHEELVISQSIGVASPPLSERGEFVILVGALKSDSSPKIDGARAAALHDRLTSGPPLTRDEADAIVASVFRSTSEETRKAIKKHRISVNRLRSSEPDAPA
jgi:16S rRNA (cytidine1402-2'-O)-methyltransferase